MEGKVSFVLVLKSGLALGATVEVIVGPISEIHLSEFQVVH